MSAEKKSYLSEIMRQAWVFVRKNGFSMSEALKVAWLNAKVRMAMKTRIVKFWFQKVDGSIREAYGTLKEDLLPPTQGTDRKHNDSVQVYYDSERESYRSFKKANLIKMA